MSDSTALPQEMIRFADLAGRKPHHFTLEPDAAGRDAVAGALGIRGVRKLRLSGDLRPMGRQDWHLNAQLGATVVQDCVVTLEPVSTRIDEPVERTYSADFQDPAGTEVEMPEDDATEPLPDTLDLGRVMIEALALALPTYPRAPGAQTGEAVFTEPGTTPLRDEDLRPFAGLAGLRDALDKDAGDED
ncbi:MAG: DUF177 domain-containing protein [Alphaproteobacteria bacterium]|jgi:uncharacterized metal-binding protein YceD (DUF177 family)|nr:DUF177 domain-containing protein [Alphaproteobacteria bacterium]